MAHEPTVDEAVGLVEEVEAIIATFPPIERSILELRLQNQSTEEITREVRRVLEKATEALRQRLRAANERSFHLSAGVADVSGSIVPPSQKILHCGSASWQASTPAGVTDVCRMLSVVSLGRVAATASR